MSPDGPAPVAAPIIVSALFAPEDQAHFDRLRRAHFPPERNVLAAHLTLFHHLPPSLADALHARLAEAAREPAPKATVGGLMNLGRGTAFAIRSEALVAIRRALADAFADALTPQDRAGWRPHVTIQNKVAPAEAESLRESLSREFRPHPVGIAALASWRYRDGSWEPLRRFPFRGA